MKSAAAAAGGKKASNNTDCGRPCVFRTRRVHLPVTDHQFHLALFLLVAGSCINLWHASLIFTVQECLNSSSSLEECNIYNKYHRSL